MNKRPYVITVEATKKQTLYIYLIIILLLINLIVVIYTNHILFDILDKVNSQLEQPKIEQTVVEPDINSIIEPDPIGETITYINLDVPTNIDTSFKTYMDWRTITNTASPQYKNIKAYAWRDGDGFMRVNADPGTDHYYLIALGSYYGTEMGTKYRITTDKGNVFYGMLGDAKNDKHTNSTHQYAVNNNDVVEFLVDTRYLHSGVKQMGSANVYTPLSGNIVSIEKIIFKEG